MLDGNNRNVKYVGDNGANSFRIRGTHNQVHVTELGRDDSVELEGPPEDWKVIRGANDGKIRYYNVRTHNSVTVQTDGGRDDHFVADRVRFSGRYSTQLPPENPQLPPLPPTLPPGCDHHLPPHLDCFPMPWPNVGNPWCFPQLPPTMPPITQDPHFLQGLLLGFLNQMTLPGNCWTLPHTHVGPELIWV